MRLVAAHIVVEGHVLRLGIEIFVYFQITMFLKMMLIFVGGGRPAAAEVFVKYGVRNIS